MASEVPPLTVVVGRGQVGETGASQLPTTFVKHRVIEALQELFRLRDDGYKWNEDDEKTGLLIADVYAFTHKEVEKKPSVIVHRGVTRWMDLTIDQRHEGWGQAAGEIRGDLLQCEVVLYCTGRGLEAETVADLTFLGISFFRSRIRLAKDVHDVIPEGVGMEQLTKTDSGVELSVVPVTVTFRFMRKWLIRPQVAEPFREIFIRPEDP